MKKIEGELRLQMLEYARQVSFDVSAAPDKINPIESPSSFDAWRIQLQNSDQHIKNIFRALALIFELKSLLRNESEEGLYVFGELDVTPEGFLKRANDLNYRSGLLIKPRTKIGELFMEITFLIATSGRHFPHYNLHPYIKEFMGDECEDVSHACNNPQQPIEEPMDNNCEDVSHACNNPQKPIKKLKDNNCEAIVHAYRSHLLFSENYVSVLSCKSKNEKMVVLSGLISVAKHVASKIDNSFANIMSGLRVGEFNVSVDNYEKKAINNIVVLNDFLTHLRAVDKHVSVVMKVSFDFHAVRERPNDSNKVEASADTFAKIITNFNASLRKATTLNGFVKMVSILKAPESTPWHNECYIALAFPKGGYPFDYNKGSLALWDKSDNLILPAMRAQLGKKWSKDHSVIAKEINELTDNGNNIDRLITEIKNAKNKEAGKTDVRQSYDDVLTEFRQHQIIFDSLAFLQTAEKRWRSSVKTQLKLEEDISIGYEARLHAMTLLDDNMSTSVISTPMIIPAMPREVCDEDAVRLLRKHNLVKHSLQMQPYPRLSRKDGQPKEVGEINLGLPKSDDMLSDMIKTSMVTQFFMTLKLYGTKIKPNGKKVMYDEVRNIFVHDKSDEYEIPARMKTSPSLSAISDIFSSQAD